MDAAGRFGLDPDGRFARAVATREAWSGITLSWRVDGGRLSAELMGLPIFDRAQNFAGYRGFGITRDPVDLARLAALRRDEFLSRPTALRTSSSGPIRPTSS